MSSEMMKKHGDDEDMILSTDNENSMNRKCEEAERLRKINFTNNK